MGCVQINYIYIFSGYILYIQSQILPILVMVVSRQHQDGRRLWQVLVCLVFFLRALDNVICTVNYIDIVSGYSTYYSRFPRLYLIYCKFS